MTVDFLKLLPKFYGDVDDEDALANLFAPMEEKYEEHRQTIDRIRRTKNYALCEEKDVDNLVVDGCMEFVAEASTSDKRTLARDTEVLFSRKGTELGIERVIEAWTPWSAFIEVVNSHHIAVLCNVPGLNFLKFEIKATVDVVSWAGTVLTVVDSSDFYVGAYVKIYDLAYKDYGYVVETISATQILLDRAPWIPFGVSWVGIFCEELSWLNTDKDIWCRYYGTAMRGKHLKIYLQGGSPESVYWRFLETVLLQWIPADCTFELIAYGS